MTAEPSRAVMLPSPPVARPGGGRVESNDVSETLWMWRRAWALVDRAERLQRQLFEPRTKARRSTPVWEPPIDVYETSEGYHVVVALPGVDPGGLELAVEGHVLAVAGHGSRPALGEAVVHRLEIPHGCFERRVALPPGAYEIGSQRWVDGCLVLLVRRVRA